MDCVVLIYYVCFVLEYGCDDVLLLIFVGFLFGMDVYDCVVVFVVLEVVLLFSFLIVFVYIFGSVFYSWVVVVD